MPPAMETGHGDGGYKPPVDTDTEAGLKDIPNMMYMNVAIRSCKNLYNSTMDQWDSPGAFRLRDSADSSFCLWVSPLP